MSTAPDNEFDLEKLFLPAWAQEPSSTKRYAHYQGEAEPSDRRGAGGGDRRWDRRGPRPPRRDFPPGERRAPQRREGGPGRPGMGGRPGGRGGDRREPREQREQREPPPPLPEVDVALLPDEKGVDSLARQIRMTGRAYPLFEIAQMILQKPERHTVAFTVKKNAEGQPIQPLFICALDDTLWLSEDEAVAHVLRKHFATFYQADRTATEPPKGKYTFVAQCGLSGVVLGPPNHHDYQNQLRKLHAERFSRMPFEAYKARVRIIRDEEVVKKWVEDQSWKTEYVCLNMPEPLRLENREAVEKHFRENHKDNIIKPTETCTLPGAAAHGLRSSQLAHLVRSVWEDQRRFPLQIATVLSQQFAARGLQFFKVNKTVTHVSVARPRYLDLAATPVSEGVKRIVEYIQAKPKCNRRQLVEALAPSPAPVAPTPPAEPTAPPPADTQAAPPAPAPAEAAEPTPEQTAVIADLHWLVHQGHVIEFASGILETAKKPVLKPPKPEPKPVEQPAQVGPPTEPVPAGEVTPPDQTPEAVPVEAAAPPADNLPIEPATAPETGPATPPGGPTLTVATPAAEPAPAAEPGPPLPDAPSRETQPPAPAETPVQTPAGLAEPAP